MGDRTRKLVSLRARTDHDLLVLVHRELETGFALAEVVTTRNSPLFAKAEKALSAAAVWLPRIATMGEDHKKRLEARMTELQSRLASVPAYGAAFLTSVAS